MACLCPIALAVGRISGHPICIAISPPTLVEQQVGGKNGGEWMEDGGGGTGKQSIWVLEL
ncbi:predicted protein [Histoplasma mississippiense (nom. inval.)]|uniref:predicted protein n=1 Tax=Ajellomyces capsulatus (strain NAm1 / WU24) TaxID=2059318 RepID=UPI000157B9E5|nr:predicted protein [Histoplasma mississippiense (nom. inval.)]EDN04045.1 predicted protein [Histoplasma mississippiense (nom. inval.)]